MAAADPASDSLIVVVGANDGAVIDTEPENDEPENDEPVENVVGEETAGDDFDELATTRPTITTTTMTIVVTPIHTPRWLLF